MRSRPHRRSDVEGDELEGFRRDGTLVRHESSALTRSRRCATRWNRSSSDVTARAGVPRPGPSICSLTGIGSSSPRTPRSSGNGPRAVSTIRLLEPVHHLAPRVRRALRRPQVDGAGAGMARRGAGLRFTSKLNFKRADRGQRVPVAPGLPVLVRRDRATRRRTSSPPSCSSTTPTSANGAIRVIPGSHASGPVRRDPADPTRFLDRPGRGRHRTTEVVVEAPAGCMLWFGAFLVHRSSPEHQRPPTPHAAALVAAGRAPRSPGRVLSPGARRRPALTARNGCPARWRAAPGRNRRPGFHQDDPVIANGTFS